MQYAACIALTDSFFLSFFFQALQQSSRSLWKSVSTWTRAAGHKLKVMLLFSPSGRPRNCLMSLKSQNSFNGTAVVISVINTCYCCTVTAQWAKKRFLKKGAPSRGHYPWARPLPVPINLVPSESRPPPPPFQPKMTLTAGSSHESQLHFIFLSTPLSRPQSRI